QPTTEIVHVTIDDTAIDLSIDTVAAGDVSILFANRGSERHSIRIRSAEDSWIVSNIMGGADATLRVDLSPGVYEVYCPDVDAGGSHGPQGRYARLIVVDSADCPQPSASFSFRAPSGGVAERLNALDLKSSDRKVRGFESHPLRSQLPQHPQDGRPGAASATDSTPVATTGRLSGTSDDSSRGCCIGRRSFVRQIGWSHSQSGQCRKMARFSELCLVS